MAVVVSSVPLGEYSCINTGRAAPAALYTADPTVSAIRLVPGTFFCVGVDDGVDVGVGVVVTTGVPVGVTVRAPVRVLLGVAAAVWDAEPEAEPVAVLEGVDVGTGVLVTADVADAVDEDDAVCEAELLNVASGVREMDGSAPCEIDAELVCEALAV